MCSYSWDTTLAFPDPSWFRDDVYALLHGHAAALCLADLPRAAIEDVVTAPFVYLRRHGTAGRYGGS